MRTTLFVPYSDDCFFSVFKKTTKADMKFQSCIHFRSNIESCHISENVRMHNCNVDDTGNCVRHVVDNNTSPWLMKVTTLVMHDVV